MPDAPASRIRAEALESPARLADVLAQDDLAYLVMARLGQLVTSLPLLTLYDSPLLMRGLLALVLSQSGRSPDLVEPTQALRRGGATTVALVNDTASPLAAAAAQVLPLHAGPERSVAATKSFIAQLAAGNTDGLIVLPAEPTAHADLDAIALVQSLYLMLEALARLRGRDPDKPPGLAKVTLTR